ncbi:MAG: class I SAM-dependent methyltransferase [Sulfobacillus sp.]
MLRVAAQQVMPPVLLSGVRWIRGRSRPANRATRAEGPPPVPWSAGFYEYKVRWFSTMLADASILQDFRSCQRLPGNFGYGVDERCIEYPWALSRLPKEPALVLDAGSTLNHGFMLDAPAMANKTIHICTLAPEPNAFHQRGVSYLYADLRELPLRDHLYDVVVCISTIEHVGCNNSGFTGDVRHHEESPDEYPAVMSELARVLKPGGTLLLTVPFGKHKHLGMQQVFDLAMLERAIASFGAASRVERTFYLYSDVGWQISEPHQCEDAEYVEWISRAWTTRQMPDPLPVEPDRAAAARAVACVEMVKF